MCCSELDLTIPTLVDDMDNTVASAFSAMPDRLFILGGNGKVAFCGDRGPRGFKVGEMGGLNR